MDRKARAGRLRPIVQTAVDRSSIRDVADEIGVPHTTLDHFLKGGVPRNATLDVVERWASEDEPAEVSEPETDDLFGDLEVVVRRLEGVGPPGAEKERKLAAIEAAERTRYLLHLPFPKWWWDIRRRVMEDEL